MSDLIAWLDRPSGATAARIGGKGASLAKLGEAGFPVPPGFAVTVEAYQQFHKAAGLDKAMKPLLKVEGRVPPAVVKDACSGLIAQLSTAALPAAVSDAISTAYAELESRAGDGATFAVRSSGVSEDGAGASFAGLYESYINLRGSGAVTEAVQKCYHCLWEPRAAHYRTIKGIDHRKEAMGVVVMETVRSHVSGVAFSLNPVTGARDEVLINSSWGLGESIVSGLVTPDNYVVAKDGAVRQKDIGDKNMQVVAVEGGTERRSVAARQAKKASLSAAQLRQVVETTVAVEEHYGTPIDIEFAYDSDGRFFLLQARPVTTR